MPSKLPIACSLTADETPARLAEIAAIGEVALLSVEQDANGATLRFEPSSETHDRLAGIVTAESKCCGFLDLKLRVDGDALVLTMWAPAEAKPVLDDLVAAFDGRVGL